MGYLVGIVIAVLVAVAVIALVTNQTDKSVGFAKSFVGPVVK